MDASVDSGKDRNKERVCLVCSEDIGEKHRGAKYCSDACRKKKRASDAKAYRQTPGKKAWQQAYQSTPEYKARQKARRSTTEYKQYHKEQQNAYYHTPAGQEYARSYRQRPEVLEKNRERSRTYRASPEGKEKIQAHQRSPKRREYDRNWRRNKYATSPEYRARVKARDLDYTFSISMAEYDRMNAEQGGRCAICEKTDKQERALSVDHNHETHEVRGLLCSNCNLGIGHFVDDIHAMLSAVEYLNRPRMAPQDIPRIPDDRMFARFEIPYWEAQSRDKKYRIQRNNSLKHKFNIDLDQYEWLLEQRNGVCWICFKPETSKKKRAKYPNSLQVDHDHLSDMIRGLLCHNCNSGLGAFADDIEVIGKAVEYVKKWNTSTTSPTQPSKDEGTSSSL